METDPILKTPLGSASTPVVTNYESNGAPGLDVQIEHGAGIKVYRRRWYIMLVFGLFSMTQCAVWNTFSPIAVACNHVFGWHDSDLSLLTNWGPIAYVLGTFVFSWIIDERGLRSACVLSAFLVAVGTGLRCITSHTPAATWLIHTGQLLNGLAGPVAMGAPTAISAVWFPPEQRTTATAVAAITNTLGLAVSFLLGPYVVPVHTDTTNTTDYPGNASTWQNQQVFSVLAENSSSNVSDWEVRHERDAIMRYMYMECGWSVLVFLMFFTYFPSRPPLPPSPTASIERLEFRAGFKALMRNATFWLICLTYGLSLGIMGCFNGVLDVNLKDHDISPTAAGWLGFIGVIASCISSFVVARGADIFSKHMKWFLLLLFVLGGVCFVVFTLSLINVVPDKKWVLYSTYILGNTLMSATIPLFFEMGCEVTYPVAEGITTLVLTLANNIAGLIFLLVQMVPNIGTMWQNWSLMGAIFLCVPVLLLLKENYNRLEVDESSKAQGK